MKKDIAILTQAPLGTNYGNTAQAYALQTVLQQKGHEVTVLDRVKYDIYTATHWNLSHIKSEILNLIDRKHRLTPRVFHEKFKDHFVFVKEYLAMSERLHTDAELTSHFAKNHYDAVIVGSDQTWRPPYSPNIYNYFLDFLETNTTITKLAYATSYGTDAWEFTEEETKRCKALVQHFDAISVREEAGVGMTKQYFDRDAVWVLDPTMLLDKTHYLKLIEAKNLPKKEGLFTYILDETPAIEKLIESAQEVLGMGHYTAQPKVRAKHHHSKQLSDYRYPSLETWLKGFADADFVLTDSFHGTVFSILFNKPFAVLVNKERGASRFYSLLGRFGLEDRILENTEADEEALRTLVVNPVDFSKAKEEMESWRKESLRFLKDAL